MDYLSLEDEDVSELFITQESSKINQEIDEKNEESDDNFLGLLTDDFQSPCVSLVNCDNKPHYSDISDDENDFSGKKERYILINIYLSNMTVRFKL